MTDLATCKKKFGHFSEDPSRFMEEPAKLTMAYEFTWGELQVLLSTCCTFEEKGWLLGAAQVYADELAARNQGHIIYLTGGDAIPDQNPQWNYQQGGRGLERRNHMITCLIEGIKRCTVKPVNYDKVREVTQEKDENPALFQGRLMEAFKKYTNINPKTPEGEVLVNTRFITQSAPDIRRKLQKAAMVPQTPMNQLMDLAFRVFNNRDRVEEARSIQGQQQKAQFLVAALIPAPPQGYPP
ncbi:Gag polyprotein [Camelus dromedarius]|uniref:Gag polyprotein n=1 Tax=Camelus dromedarius TaxID=9838 RepID=A0A5N4DFE1_CAMDR|nr:Gag polyprotein [Camelus dromedarius]